jgi:hypothetical protein
MKSLGAKGWTRRDRAGFAGLGEVQLNAPEVAEFVPDKPDNRTSGYQNLLVRFLR